MMSSTRVFAALLMVLLGGSGWVWAQEENPPAPAVEEQQEAPPPPPPASPPPGEEVMTPTQHGIRFTHRMAEGFGRQLAKAEFDQEVGLDQEQQGKMADIITRRAWDLNVRMGREGCEAIECFYENIIRGASAFMDKKGMSPEDAREFSRRVRPGVKIIDEFWKGLLEDVRPVLDKDQYAKFEKQARDALKMTERFDAKLDRWSRGEVKANEGIMDGVDEHDIEAEETGKSKEYVQAEQGARWRVDTMGPFEWRQFLNRVMSICQFDDAQKKAGRKLLGEYIEKASAVMTKEWKGKALANRVRRQLEDKAPQEPLAPWGYHLDMEYKQLVLPIQEMGRAFHRDVLALATSEQRDRLFGELRKLATEHGMRPEEIEGLEPWLTPPQTQPEVH